MGILMQSDRLKRTYVEEVTHLIDQYPDIGAFWFIEDMIDKEGELKQKRPSSRDVVHISQVPEPYTNILIRGTIWTISGSLIKRDFYRPCPFLVHYPHRGDFAWILRVVRNEPIINFSVSPTGAWCP